MERKQYWINKHNIPYYNYSNININSNLDNYIQNLPSIKTFLDHGCGHGRITKIICSKYSNINITIQDIATNALNIATEAISKTNTNNKINIVSYPLHHLTGSFDCIISHRVIHSCENYKNIFKELKRLLSKEGSCFISVRSTLGELKYPNNIIRKDNGKFTKLFSEEEFYKYIQINNMDILQSGSFTEKSARLDKNKENNYLYAICKRSNIC